MEKKKYVLRRAGDVVLVIVIMGLLLPFALIGALYIWFAGLLFLLPLLVVLYVSLGTILVGGMFGKSKYEKNVYRVVIAFVALSLIAATPGIYNKTRPVVQDGQVDTNAYEPFRDHTKAVTLTKPSVLKIEDNLPIIDGATALYPVYAAFAQAVYPEKSMTYTTAK